jgi:hypothetical protein
MGAYLSIDPVITNYYPNGAVKSKFVCNDSGRLFKLGTLYNPDGTKILTTYYGVGNEETMYIYNKSEVLEEVRHQDSNSRQRYFKTFYEDGVLPCVDVTYLNDQTHLKLYDANQNVLESRVYDSNVSHNYIFKEMSKEILANEKYNTNDSLKNIFAKMTEKYN